MRIAPREAVEPHVWTRDLQDRPHLWRFRLPGDVAADIAALEAWAQDEAQAATDGEDPIGRLTAESVATPALTRLAAEVKTALTSGPGVALVAGDPTLGESALRLLYLKFGLALGRPNRTYGLVYEVTDTGQSHTTKAIPVSQTKARTGMHTDSSQIHVHPRFVGLACVRRARQGGASRVASAAFAHEALRSRAPDLLRRLYEPFVRDLVTPGSTRDREALQANRFPVFSFSDRLSLRYMRYWIEKGHARLGEVLDERDLAAFDALDALLNDPDNQIGFVMEPGDMLFIDNTLTTHDRDAFEDDPAHKRLMLRLWLDEAR